MLTDRRTIRHFNNTPNIAGLRYVLAILRCFRNGATSIDWLTSETRERASAVGLRELDGLIKYAGSLGGSSDEDWYPIIKVVMFGNRARNGVAGNRKEKCSCKESEVIDENAAMSSGTRIGCGSNWPQFKSSDVRFGKLVKKGWRDDAS